MGYGGIDEVEIDAEHGRFYVHREDSDRWNVYKIESEPGFLDWIYEMEGEIDIFDLDTKGERIENQGVPW